MNQQIAILYCLFAAIATVFNLGLQELSTMIYSGYGSLALAIIVGTGAGLVVKYLLDKRYIFKFQTQNASHDGQVFVLYTAMGLITTVIFWGFEFGFDYYFQSKEMRYLGAVLGLAIGYISKYQLDKKFVFVSKESA